MPEEKPEGEPTRLVVQLTKGTSVGHYVIIEKIGAGGMGEVYLAEDTELNRKVALKFLSPHLCQDADCRTRFKREAQAAAKLNHPNIVTIHEVSEFGGRPYIVMEHVEGESLHHFAHDKQLPIDVIVDYAMQICQGIGEAHRAGVIHRDIKSTNIIVDTKGRARLLDFGLAAVAGDDKLTKTGSTLGTVSYMSPEQVSGREIDHRSDLFSFGIVLYELVAGRTPFRRDSDGATLRAIMQDVPEPLSRYKSDVPLRLQQIVDKLMEKDRELRYQTAEDIIADLKRLVYDSQQTGHRPPPEPAKSKLRLVIGATIVILVAALAFIFFPRPKSTQTETGNDVPMIAVLPFENLGNPEDEYFADGMTEEITSRLVGIEGLGVISRTSAMQYKKSGKSLSQIGKELGVNYILEGSVRWAKVGGQTKVRITPQLIRVSDDRHMWADNYERELMEVFAVQEDIATKIVDQLGLTLLESNRKVLASCPTTNSKAYDYYLKGISGVRRDYWALPELTAAAANLDSAVMIDPSFAIAYAVRSRAYTLLDFIVPSTVVYRKIARESFEKALQLQPNLSYGHMAAGIYYNLTETDYDQAMTELNLAFSELPSDAELVTNIALVQWRQGRFDEATESFRKATELDPLNPAIHSWRSEFFRFRRMFSEAEQSVDRAIALDPKRPYSYLEKLWGYNSRYGDWNKNREVVREALSYVDTLEFVNTILPMVRSLDGLPLDSLFADRRLQYSSFFDRFREKYYSKMNDNFYAQLACGYGEAGDAALKAVYLDSARVVIEKQLQEVPDNPYRTSALGIVMANLGLCKQAVELGIRGKELLSIAKCHW